jgi:hypothetical protein
MKSVRDLLDLFGLNGAEPLKILEDFGRFEATSTASIFTVPEHHLVEEWVNRVLQWGNFIITVSCDENDSIALDSTKRDYQVFLSALQAELDFGIETCVFKLVLFKRQHAHSIPLFSLPDFVAYVASLDCKEQLKLLWSHFQDKGQLAFELVESSAVKFNTKSIFFISGRNHLTPDEESVATTRSERFNSIRNVCHFESASECQFVPEDFRLVHDEGCPSALKLLFHQLCGLISVTSLFDITRLVQDGTEYKLNGYKSISGSVSSNKLHSDSVNQYYQLYDWVYSSGNLTDKIGLTRNLISIHLISSETLELNGSPFDSVRSAFEVYLKQNIKQYIELRSKISDQLVDQTNKATKIAEEFAGSYKKSIIAFVSFFASIIVAKVFTTKELHGAFTREATGVALAFLVIASVYFILSYVEFSAERKRFIKNYENLKSRFTDLLVQTDINRILGGDKIHNDDLVYMRNKIRRFSAIWSLTLLIMLITLLSLSETLNFETIYQWLSTSYCNVSSCA